MNKSIKDILKIALLRPTKYFELLEVSLKRIILALLITCAIAGGVLGITTTLFVGEAIDIVVDVLEKEENLFEIKDGILNMKKEEVQLENGNTILYINPNKEIKDMDSLRSILIHKDVYSAILKDGVSANISGQKANFKYSDVKVYSNLNTSTIIKWLNIAQTYKYVIILIQIIIVFVFMMFYSIIIYLLGSLISKLKKVKLSKAKMYKMSILAIIPQGILQITYYTKSLGFLISVLFISLAITSIRNKQADN